MTEMKLFESFFWIEAKKIDDILKPKVVWYYPENVSQITKEFRDIPQICFPDLDILRLEKGENATNENFLFTLNFLLQNSFSLII